MSADWIAKAVAFVGLVCIGLGLPLRAQQPAQGSLPSADWVERLAGEIRCFPAHEFLYDRFNASDPVPYYAEAESWRRSAALVREFLDADFSTNQLVAMLRHDNPRVKTLALAALFDRQEPHLIPHFYALLDDTNRTFDCYIPAPPEPDAGFKSGVSPPIREQTVRLVASQFLSLYVPLAAYLDTPAYMRIHDEFAEYWKARGRRTWCAHWFAAHLRRATQGIVPIPAERRAKIDAVYAQIDKLPKTERALCYLWLQGEALTNAEERLIQAAKDLGPEVLMGIIRGDIPSSDPDILASGRAKISPFILRHATELLRRGDAAEILRTALEGPEKYMAVAELEPENAGPFLRSVLKTNEWSDLVVWLWKFEGTNALDWAVRWLYKTPQDLTTYPHAPARFLDQIRSLNSPDDIWLCEALVRHERFELLDFQSMQALLRIVNARLGSPLVHETDMWQARHRPDEALRLAQWKEALRRHFGLPPLGLNVEAEEVKTIEASGFLGHDSPVVEVSFSPDSRYLATRTRDQDFKVWDAITLQELWRSPPGERAFTLRFSPDGTKLLTVGFWQFGGVLNSWDITNRFEKRLGPGWEADSFNATISSDARLVACGGMYGGDVAVVNLKSGELLAMSGQQDTIGAWVIVHQLSPDGRILASARRDQTVWLWDTRSGALLHRLSWRGAGANAVAFSPDAELLAEGGEDARLNLWKVKSGERLFSWICHGGPVQSVAFSPGGSLLAVGAWDGVVRIFRVSNGRLALAFKPSQKGAVEALAFSPDGKLLVAAITGQPYRVHVWSMKQLPLPIPEERSPNLQSPPIGTSDRLWNRAGIGRVERRPVRLTRP